MYMNNNIPECAKSLPFAKHIIFYPLYFDNLKVNKLEELTQKQEEVKQKQEEVKQNQEEEVKQIQEKKIQTQEQKQENRENDIPRIAHLIWVGESPKPNYFDSNTNKWKELMPSWEIKVWKNEDITLQHFPERAISLIHQCKKGAQKADIMRYFII